MTATINASTSGGGGIIQTADASGILALQTAGVTAVTINASQNVGVGTSSPTRKFQVSNTSIDPFVSIIGAASNEGGVLFGDNASDAVGQIRYAHTSDAMYFVTNASERARIDSSGNLLVGTTVVPTGATGGSCFEALSNSRWALKLASTTTSSATLCNFVNPNGSVGSISTSGSTTTYATSSDYRLKNTIAPMTGALARIAALKPVTYKWNADNSDGEGFIAHELAEVVPDAVVGEKDAVDEDGNAVYQGIDTSFLVATLTAAIQEQQAIITTLTERISALEAK